MHLARDAYVAELLGIPFDDVTQVALIPVADVLGQRLGAAARRPVPEIVGFDEWDGPWPA